MEEKGERIIAANAESQVTGLPVRKGLVLRWWAGLALLFGGGKGQDYSSGLVLTHRHYRTATLYHRMVYRPKEEKEEAKDQLEKEKVGITCCV